MELSDLPVTTARYAGLDELSDSELFAAIDGQYDALITLDGSIPYQQKVVGRSFAVIVLRVPDQTPEAFRALVPALKQVIAMAKPGEVRRVG
jgi:hypothetical protein